MTGRTWPRAFTDVRRQRASVDDHKNGEEIEEKFDIDYDDIDFGNEEEEQGQVEFTTSSDEEEEEAEQREFLTSTSDDDSD